MTRRRHDKMGTCGLVVQVGLFVAAKPAKWVGVGDFAAICISDDDDIWMMSEVKDTDDFGNVTAILDVRGCRVATWAMQERPDLLLCPREILQPGAVEDLLFGQFKGRADVEEMVKERLRPPEAETVQ